MSQGVIIRINGNSESGPFEVSKQTRHILAQAFCRK